MYKFAETGKGLEDTFILHYAVKGGFKDMVLVAKKDINAVIAQLKEQYDSELESVFFLDAYKMRELKK